MPVGSTDAPPPADRAGTLGDGRTDTGFINMQEWAVTFGQDIVNRPGPDIILLDWGTSSDSIDITIGSTTLDDVTSSGTAVSLQNGLPRFPQRPIPGDFSQRIGERHLLGSRSYERQQLFYRDRPVRLRVRRGRVLSLPGRKSASPTAAPLTRWRSLGFSSPPARRATSTTTATSTSRT